MCKTINYNVELPKIQGKLKHHQGQFSQLYINLDEINDFQGNRNYQNLPYGR